MDIHIVMRQIHDADGDIGAVVGHALQIGQQIRPDEAGVDGAIPLLQTLDVRRTQGVLQIVDDLFQGRDGHDGIDVTGGEGAECQLQDLPHGGYQRPHFILSGSGEGDLFFTQFFDGFQNVDAVVGNTLEITDRLEQHSRLGTVRVTDRQRAELDQIRTEDILVVIGGFLVGAYQFRFFGRVVVHAIQRIVQRLHRVLRHFGGDGVATLQCHRGCVEQTVVQFGGGFRRFSVGNKADDQLFEQTAHRHQQRGTQNVEDRVRYGNADEGCRLIQYDGMQCQVHDPKYRQPRGGADDVEQEVHQCGTTRVFIGTDTRKDRRDTGTDVLTHNDRNSGTEGDLAGCCQRLQDTDGCRAGLDDRGEHRACQHTQQRILEH